jgi:hypothetical protein
VKASFAHGRRQSCCHFARWLPRLTPRCQAIFEMAAAVGTTKIALDLGSPTTNRYLTRYEIEHLARGRLPLGSSDVVAEVSEVRIGRPAVPPPVDASEAVRSQLKAETAAQQSSDGVSGGAHGVQALRGRTTRRHSMGRRECDWHVPA